MLITIKTKNAFYVKKTTYFSFTNNVIKNTYFIFRLKKKLTDIGKGHKFDL